MKNRIIYIAAAIAIASLSLCSCDNGSLKFPPVAVTYKSPNTGIEYTAQYTEKTALGGGFTLDVDIKDAELGNEDFTVTTGGKKVEATK